MSRFSLSTILTIAMGVGFCENIFAQLDPTAAMLSKGAPADISAYIKTSIKKMESDENRAKFTNCNEANKEFAKIKADLGKHCAESRATFDLLAKAQGSTDRSTNRDELCMRNILRCTNCSSGASYADANNEVQCYSASGASGSNDDDLEKERRTSASDTVRDMTLGILGSAPTSSGGKVDRAALEADLINCLPQNSDELKSLESATKDLRREIRKSQEEVTTAGIKLGEANTEAQETINTSRDKAEEIQTKAKEDVEKISAELEEGNAQAVNQIQNETMAIDAKIRELRYKKRDANQAYNNALVQMDQGCHANALARTEAVRKDVSERIRQGTYSPGGFNAVMGGVGQTSREMFRKMAKGYYLDCRNDDSYKMAQKSAQAAKDNAEQSINEEINSLENQKTLQRARLAQLQNTANKRAIEAIQRVQKRMELALTNLDRKNQAESRKSQQKLMEKGLEINRLNRNLKEDQDDFEEQNQKFKLLRKYKKYGAGGGKEGSFDAAQAAMSSLGSAGDTVIAACCPFVENKATGEDAANQIRFCKAACSQPGVAKGLCPKGTVKQSPLDPDGTKAAE